MTAKEILKELFPDVFKVAPPEWEDITTQRVTVKPGEKAPVIEIDDVLFQVKMHDDKYSAVVPYEKFENYKIENGRIWRKRGA